jgi:hypothetical protein
MSIPNIIHFLFFGFTEFNIIHYLSILSTRRLNPSATIMLYNEKEPENNIFWNYIKPLTVLVKVTAPTEFRGIPLHSYQYKADIMRLEKLLETGGIYMDIDILSIKSIEPLLTHAENLGKECILGIEAGNPYNPLNPTEMGSITNAVIMTKPGQAYIRHWYEETAHNLKDKPWAYHAVCLPKHIIEARPDFVEKMIIYPKEFFMPFCFRDGYIFEKNQKHRINELDGTYTMHLWETIWNDSYINKINIRYFFQEDNILVQLFQKYILELPLDNVLLNLVKEYYHSKNYTTIYNLALEKLINLNISETDHSEAHSELLFYHSYACQHLNKIDEAKLGYQSVLNLTDNNNIFHIYSRCNLNTC